MTVPLEPIRDRCINHQCRLKIAESVSRYSTVTEPLESIDEVRNMPWFDETKSAVIKERGLEKKNTANRLLGRVGRLDNRTSKIWGKPFPLMHFIISTLCISLFHFVVTPCATMTGIHCRYL